MRALMGTADTPALPISGLIFLFLGRMRLKSFTNSTPLLEAITKAMKPRKKMKIVCGVRNCEACVDAPTVMPRRMVTMSVSAFEAVFARRVVTPHSRSRLPKKSMPSRGRPEGTTKQVRSMPTMGKMIFSFWLTARAGFILMRRSFFVVNRRISGGWITGTRAM